MKHKGKKHSKGYVKYIIGAIVIVAVVVIAIMLSKGKVPAGKSNVVTVDFYVMSKCPYGIQAEDFIAPVLEKLGSAVDFNLNFIAGDSGNGQFNSLHGATEVQGDIVQLCAEKYEPQKYMKLVSCMNKDANSIPDNWQDCSKSLGLNSNSIKTCSEGSEGKQLLSDSIKKANAVNAGASPTIIINGQAYEGQRDTSSLTRAICKYSTSSACSNMPVCAADSDCNQQQGKIGTCKNPDSASASCE